MTGGQFYALPEDEQAWELDKWTRDRLRCSCGRERSECGDPAVEWFPVRTVCYQSMEEAAANARYAELHDKQPYHDGTFASWSTKRSRSHPYHYNDGVTITAATVDVNPDDDFLTQQRLSED